jgi:phage portal protein BeeE
MQEAREYFYLNAVFNVVDQLISELNVWLVPKFGDNLYLTRDDESILALENLRQRKRESVLSLFNSNLISLNEARAVLGYEAVEGGDQIMVSAGKLPIDFDQMPSDGAVQEALDE